MYHKIEPNQLSKRDSSSLNNQNPLGKENWGRKLKQDFIPGTQPSTPWARSVAASTNRQDSHKKAKQSGEHNSTKYCHELEHDLHNPHHQNRSDKSNSQKYSSQGNRALQCPGCSHQMHFHNAGEAYLGKLVKREMLMQEEEILKQHLIKERERYQKAIW